MNAGDWQRRIGELVFVQQDVRAADRSGLWDYHLPRVAAKEASLRLAEAHLGGPLDEGYRLFLMQADGWPSFWHDVDLFGTTDLTGGSRMERALGLLPASGDAVWRSTGINRESALPIAAATDDVDVFVIARSTPHRGSVLWLAGSMVDHFQNFDEFFLSMIEYNRLTAQNLRAPS